MTYNRDEHFFYDGIARRKKLNSEEYELVAAFVCANKQGKQYLGSVSAEHLQTTAHKEMTAGMYASTLAQAFKAAEALKWAAQDIKDGKITLESLPDWHEVLKAEEKPTLYRPKTFR